ncbi:hypothetical protein HPB49_010022 [Dermacentor silvarum]|uniref:Uncharacterized protein n=1 Tax=Dermacentor silvarum TaxID=543639 RepID=A0ACB8CKI9_DERSI|nr:hypothetical protein HPB49_010022 [Dermacentor silvarum]
MGRRYRRRRQGPPLLLCAPVARAFSLGGGGRALSFVGVERRKEPAPTGEREGREAKEEQQTRGDEEGRFLRVAKLYVGFLRKDSAGGGGLRRPRWGWFRENERAAVPFGKPFLWITTLLLAGRRSSASSVSAPRVCLCAGAVVLPARECVCVWCVPRVLLARAEWCPVVSMVVARSDGAAAAGMDTPDDPVLLAKQSDWNKASQLFHLDSIRVKREYPRPPPDCTRPPRAPVFSSLLPRGGDSSPSSSLSLSTPPLCLHGSSGVVAAAARFACVLRRALAPPA